MPEAASHPPAAAHESLSLVEVACPLCGSGRWTKYLVCRDLLYGVPGEFQLVRCDGCRHVYMNPRPAADELPRCYPEWYVPHQHECGAATAPPQRTPWYLSPAVRRIPGLRALYYRLTDTRAWYVPPRESGPKRGLELGCATGDFLEHLRREGWTVRGIEPAEAPAGIARRRRFAVHVGTLESAELPDASFDAVFAWMVVEHLPDPRTTLDEIRRVLVPGGCFAFSVPNFGCWEPRVFGRCWAGFDAPRHLQHFTPRSLRQLLTECGFTLQRIIHQSSPLYPVGSLGLWLRERFPRWRIGHRLVDSFLQNPPLWLTLLLAPPAKLQSLMRQSGRLTVLARRREVSSASP